MTRLVVEWHPLEPPRAPSAVLAEGDATHELAAAAARRVRGGSTLRAAARAGVLLVVGEAEHLPWAEGVTYLGEEDGVLLPTTRAPGLPADLLRQAVVQRLGPGSPHRRVAVVPGRVVSFELAEAAVDPVWLDDRSREKRRR